MAQVVEDWYKQMPVITRSYITLSVLTTVGCALEVRLQEHHTLVMTLLFSRFYQCPIYVGVAGYISLSHLPQF